MKAYITYWGKILLLLVFTGSLGSFSQAQNIPTQQGFVNDYKGLLSPSQKQELEFTLANFAQNTSNEISILISDLPQDAELRNYSYQVARTWGVGGAEENNGVLLAVYMNVRKFDIEVGYGLEPVIPDILAYNVIQQDLSPAFKQGQYFEGLKSATDVLMKAAQEEFDEASRQQYYQQNRRRRSQGEEGGIGTLIVPLIIIILFVILSRRGGGGRGGRGGGYGGGGWYWGPTIFGGGFGGGGGGGDFGGGFGGGGGGFGGFGGGDFGGGGAMGDW
ncbi:MAG: TPM domain-containing protein [Bacteroidota bacterium]